MPNGLQGTKPFETSGPLPEGVVDVVVVGAGVNGLAVARDLAVRGASVVVLERDDVGARTSAISSRLIHGGLKYLERLDLRLVVESIVERNRLLRTAPHLVRRYPMLIPFYRGASRPGWLLAAGAIVHDVMSVGKRLPLNRLVSKRELRRRWPGLDTRGLQGGVVFEDAQVPLSERLCVELALGAHEHGAVFRTHSTVTRIVPGSPSTVEYRDEIEGGAPRRVRARVVVNAAGPWVDEVLGRADGASDRLIGPTKGTHIVVEPFPGAPETCVFFEARSDQRPMFVMPWGTRYMIGCTDIPYDEDLDEIVASREEIDYLIDETNALVPSARLRHEDVLWSYSGVRPLPYVGPVTDPSKISRGHVVVRHTGELAGVVSIVGGKLTTHRALGQDVGDVVVGMLPGPRHRSTTARLAFPGAVADPQVLVRELAATTTLAPADVRRLVGIYGSRAAQVLALVRDDPALGQKLGATGTLAAEIVHGFEHEGARSLADCLVRRTALVMSRDRGLAVAEDASRVAAARLGWNESRRKAELAATVHELSSSVAPHQNDVPTPGLTVERKADHG